MAIEWHDVESSNVASTGYEVNDNGLNVELHVRFKSGAEYIYHDVPADTVQKFLDADSQGKFLNENIKGKFDYNKVAG